MVDLVATRQLERAFEELQTELHEALLRPETLSRIGGNERYMTTVGRCRHCDARIAGYPRRQKGFEGYEGIVPGVDNERRYADARDER